VVVVSTHISAGEIRNFSLGSKLGMLTLVTATANSKSEIGWSVLLENDKDSVITAGVITSRVA
jgi:hypothetical protein